jgi:3'-phosphoadenosine 5'-phosphosulfate sulfotransferase (PAPS reductase)/FAD synthetase
MNVIFASYGNDSIALIQWAAENKLPDVTVLYSDTGWAAPDWLARVTSGEQLAQSYGFSVVRTTSEGLLALVKRKKGWPRQGLQFCTEELKIKPALAWLDANDPLKEATCLIGVRREESANRAQFPEYVLNSDKHGGREVHAPLVRHTEADRDALLSRAGFTPLPHRSMECYPCVNSNRADLRELAKDPDRISLIDVTEQEMGYTAKGKLRSMFRPYRHMGAIGIREVIKWAESDRGEYIAPKGCDGGWCGD